MAKLCPTLTPHAATRAGDYAELDLMQTLERGLSDAYTLFHRVDWSRGSAGKEQHGEIDVVVVNQAGDVLLMEVKAGHVDFLPGGIFKTYGSHIKDVKAQVGLQYGGFVDSKGHVNERNHHEINSFQCGESWIIHFEHHLPRVRNESLIRYF